MIPIPYLRSGCPSWAAFGEEVPAQEAYSSYVNDMQYVVSDLSHVHAKYDENVKYRKDIDIMVNLW